MCNVLYIYIIIINNLSIQKTHLGMSGKRIVKDGVRYWRVTNW